MNESQKEFNVRKRFFDKVDIKDSKEKCWVWQGAVTPYGYGYHHFNGKRKSAHRLMYTFTYGEIPEGLIIRHKCREKLCCNPYHLCAGTHAQNTQDMYDYEKRIGKSRKNHLRYRSLYLRELFYKRKHAKSEEEKSQLLLQELYHSTIGYPNVNKCWGWDFSKTKFGYGIKQIDKKFNLAHRLTYQLVHGEIPEGLNVLHHCDEPSCINPDHLYAGTAAQNTQDSYDRKRRIKTSGGSFKTQLENKNIVDIFLMCSEGSSIEDIAKIYEMSVLSVRRILNRTTWKDVRVEEGLFNKAKEILSKRLRKISSNAKLTYVEAYEIRIRYAEGNIKQSKLAKEYGIASDTINDLLQGETYVGAGIDEVLQNKINEVRKDNQTTKLTEKDIKEIRRRYAEGGITYTQLAIEYNVDNTTIGNVTKRKTWKHIK